MSDSTWGRSSSSSDEGSGGVKDTSAAQPEQVVPDSSGVQPSDSNPSPANDDNDVQQPVAPGTTVTTEEKPSEQEGVKVGGLTYTQGFDGVRRYEGQEPVETTGDPTPQPEQVDAPAPESTNQKPGQ